MKTSQEHASTTIYAQAWGANRVHYGELKNREYLQSWAI